MKETTKKKIKKAVKISAIVIGAILATLGAVFSAALLTKCGSAAEQKSPVVLARREAVNTSDSMQPDYYFSDVGIYDWSNTQIQLNHNTRRYCYAFTNLPAGSYIFQYDGYVDFWTCKDSLQVQNSITALRNASEDDDSSSIYSVFASSDVPFVRYGSLSFDIILEFETSVNGVFFNFYLNEPQAFRFVNAFYATPLFSVDFKQDFFPFQGIGSAGGNPVIISDLSYDGTTGYPVRRFDLDGIYFVSGKRLWSGISILYESAYRQSFFTADGQYFSVLDTHAWYITGVQYYYGPKESPYYYEKVWDMTRDYQRNSGEVTQMYYGAGTWVANMYRYINVVYINSPDTAQTAPNGLAYTPEAWIDVLLTPYQGNITIEVLVPDGGNVFSLFTNAFGALIPLFDSQVLPGISFGMLIFLPIIAGIIVIIVKVVKK